MAYCKECGKEIAQETRFCEQCGAIIEPSASPGRTKKPRRSVLPTLIIVTISIGLILTVAYFTPILPRVLMMFKADKGWSGIAGNAQHTSVTDYHVEPPLRSRWWNSLLVGRSDKLGIFQLGQLQPAIADGLVYVGSWPEDSNDPGKVYALDVKTGTKVWSYEAREYEAFCSPPAIDNGTVYINSNYSPESANRRSKVYALDAKTGEKLWSYEARKGESFISAPAVVNDMVYVSSTSRSDNVHSAVYALDAKTGEKLWNYEMMEAGSTFDQLLLSPAVDEGRVYVSFLVPAGKASTSKVYALDAKTGDKLWGYKASSSKAEQLVSSPSTADGKVYFSTVTFLDENGDFNSKVYALDGKTGDKLWSYKARKGEAFVNTPTLADRMVFISSSADYGDMPFRVYALDAVSGDEIWSHESKGAKEGHLGLNPVAANGIAYVPLIADGVYVYAFDAKTGKKIWNYYHAKDKDEENYISQLAVGNGYICFTSITGQIATIQRLDDKHVPDTPKQPGVHTLISKAESDSIKEKECQANLRTIDGAIQVYYAKHGDYPYSIDNLVSSNGLKKAPVEPFGGKYSIVIDCATCSKGHKY